MSSGLLQGREPFGHVDIHVLVSGEAESPETSDVLGELHSEGRVTIRHVEGRRVSDIAAHLAQRPVHLLVVAGQRERHVAFVSREATRLHPLAVPHQIVATTSRRLCGSNLAARVPRTAA